MNPNMKVVNYTVPVGPDSEDTFSDEFWGGIDAVINALDNIKARLYMDLRCVFYHKPLFESGTMGTKANAQIVLPNLSENYGASQDPPDKGIPMCTLKNFPNEINHTIEWARDLFNGFFTNGVLETISYIDGGQAFLDALPTKIKHVVERRTVLESIASNLSLASGNVTFEDCIAWARNTYQDLYDNKIQQLLSSYPLEYRARDGSLFWSGPKRPPTALPFDPEDTLSLAFVIATANLRAANFGVLPPAGKGTDAAYFKSVLAAIKVPHFTPKKGVVINDDPKSDNAGGGADDEEVIQQVLASLPKPDPSLKKKLIPADFEKDVDSNFHIDFVTATSNLRARNYVIPEATRQKTKGIAGRIIPAIATTTAMVTGLVGLEFYKLQKSTLALSDFKNAFVNLALPLFLFSEPLPPKKVRARIIKETDSAAKRAAEELLPVAVYPPEGYTPWDKLVVEQGDLTVGQFIDAFAAKFGGLQVDSISVGTFLVYNSTFKKHADRKDKKIVQLYENFVGAPVSAKKSGLMLNVAIADETDVPPVYYKFR
jgi:ubiquitin-activating enzyme E1